MRELTLKVYGTPAPQGSKRPFGVSKTGKFMMREQSANLPAWREAVKAAALAAWEGRRPLSGPLTASVVFTVRKPKSAPKTRKTWPTGRPDLSKLLRSTEDALTDAGVWDDDSRVVLYTKLAKVYPQEDMDALLRPGALIVIYAPEDR